MALQTEQLKEDLKAGFQLARNSEDGEDAALEAFCVHMASAFEKYVKTAKVVYTTGLVAAGNQVTGTLTHTIE